ncbi:protein tim21 [Aspergillus nidulans FGSC A4]|uniref:Mitochondrial import inner membrane translocase subunit Tim21 n=1 Tax=Emericella nidulans (strain FGSC A4 / ATCC 38163 / CBS 112.46 / NRRL 194 / M139) TaxID=227321 RepID=C8V311_EMENI|nr:hypothetical protein [Aspergillus nidulans FGSC A4]CBF70319.1 TPA: conserved hypothetical protein [Aspergillus nidulans FGSC A4]
MSLTHFRPSPLLRPSLVLSQPLIPRTSQSTYATHSDLGRGSASAPRRRNVTVLSDDGRYTWSELSGREKVARATQQSINFVVVLAGAALTVNTIASRKTWQFEKAVERIKNDARFANLIAGSTTIEKDHQGREHMRMNFHVSGPRNSGTVFVHMVKPTDANEWEYRLLALEVKGYSRVVLEERHDPKVGGEVKIFGIRWR